MTLRVIVPSRGRPGNIRRLREAWATASAASLLVVVDDDDPALGEYQADGPVTVLAGPRKLGPILNAVSEHVAGSWDHVGFMGDDHLPRTQEWDLRLVEALGGRPGVAYGNDLVQGERLATAVVISSELVRAPGYMCPPGLIHLFLDDYWLELGRAVGNLVYLPDVIVEHLHPIANTAARDAGYEFSLDPALMDADRRRYEEFITGRWLADRERLLERLAEHG